jgi:ADP-heptose:LPS heptosyltransferase
MSQKRKILVQRADRLGDVVLALPVIEALKENFPDVEISFLTSKIGADFVSNHPHISKIYTYDPEAGNYFELIKEIKGQGYIAYISLWNDAKMAWLGLLSRIPIRIGDSTNPSLKFCYTKKVRQDWTDFTRHQAEFNLDLLAPLNIKSNKIKRALYTDSVADKTVAAIAKKFINPERKNILVFCGTGGTNYPIPENAVIEFVDLVKKSNRFNVVLCGPSPQNPEIASLSGDYVVNFLGKTSLQELVSFIDFADYYVGPDTGPTHIAAFLQKPIVFFSPLKPNPPSRWGALVSYVEILRKEYNCAHFASRGCTSDECFSYVDGRAIYSVFVELVHKLEINDARNEKESKRYRLLNSYRVLYVVKNKKEFVNSFETIDSYRDHGLKIFPVYMYEMGNLAMLMKIIKIVKEKNINIIQGSLPRWQVVLIQFIIGTIHQYIKPIYCRQLIHRYIKLKEVMDIYEKAWKSK